MTDVKPMSASRANLVLGVSAAAVAVPALGALVALTLNQKNTRLLILVGGLDGDSLQLISAVALGLSLVMLLRLAASVLWDKGGVARIAFSILIYAIVTVIVAFGGLIAVLVAVLNTSVEYLRLDAPDGREIVVSTTTFSSSGYSIYLGSGAVFREIEPGLHDVSSEPPRLDTRDFTWEERDGTLVLHYALTHGGKHSSELELPPGSTPPGT